MSSAVTIVTDDGASVTRCSRRAAPKTVPTSTDIRSSRLLLASAGGSAGGACARAGAAVAGEDDQGEKGGRSGQSHGMSYPTMRARRSEMGADLETGAGGRGGVGFETDARVRRVEVEDDAGGAEPGAVADGEHRTAFELAEQDRQAIALGGGDEQELRRGADVAGAPDRAHLDRPAGDLLSGRGLLDGLGQVVGAQHHDLDRGVGRGRRRRPGDELQEIQDERGLDLLIVELPGGAHRRDQQRGDRRQQGQTCRIRRRRKGRAASRTIGHTCPVSRTRPCPCNRRPVCRRESSRTRIHAAAPAADSFPEVPGAARRA